MTGDSMEPVSIPIRVDWQTMMTAKLANSLRMSRLLLFVFASCGLGTAVGVDHDLSILKTSLLVMGALIVIRLLVMGVSAAHDQVPRRRFNGTLTLRDEGLELKRHDGISETHPWDWVLSAERRGDVLRLRLNERGGRFWASFSLARLAELGVVESALAHLRKAGKLPA